MKRIRSFNENWKDIILHPIDTAVNKHNAKVKKYADQFQVEYSKLTTEEKILKEALISLETESAFLSQTQTGRYLGAIEAVLIMNGLIEPGDKNFHSGERNIFGYNYKTQEGYAEHIIRLSKKLLSDRGIL